MGKKAVAITCWIVGVVGVIAGIMSAQQQYSSVANQAANIGGQLFAGAPLGQSLFGFLTASPLFWVGVVALVVGMVLAVSPSSPARAAQSAPLRAGSPMSTTASTRPCPFCAEEINVQAIKCKHCGSTVETGQN